MCKGLGVEEGRLGSWNSWRVEHWRRPQRPAASILPCSFGEAMKRFQWYAQAGVLGLSQLQRGVSLEGRE